MRKILLVALTAAAMVSCSENEGFENENTVNRIKFGTVVKTGTKTLVATTENFSKFTVSAYKTTDEMGGTVQLNTGFMDDIEVDKSSGEWKYEGDYYWPISGKLQFFATSPAQTLDVTTAAGYPKFEYTVKAVDSQEDLVAANVINQVKSESAISLPFQHLLTQVNFTIKGDVADFIYTVSKLVIKGAKDKATFTFDGSSTVGAWSNLAESVSGVTYEYTGTPVSVTPTAAEPDAFTAFEQSPQGLQLLYPLQIRNRTLQNGRTHSEGRGRRPHARMPHGSGLIRRQNYGKICYQAFASADPDHAFGMCHRVRADACRPRQRRGSGRLQL